MSTEEEIKRWVREERAAIKAEEQAACEHMISGTLHSDGRVTCIECDKVVTIDDWNSHQRILDCEREGYEAPEDKE